MARLESTLTAPAIWVSGPAGSGKTTLVADFIRRNKRHCIWYQVDERDVDPGTFFHYMTQAAQKALSKKIKQIPLFSPESLPGLTEFTLTFFENIFSRLRKNSLVVFDNYQWGPEDAQLNNLIKTALALVPRALNIIIISREPPPKALINFLANNTMEMLLWEDLKLSLDETRKILAMRSKRRYSDQQTKNLHQITHGWVSGLTLWIQASMLSSSSVVRTSCETPEEIFDYFANEIFSNTCTKMQHFLIATSFLPKMNISMADEIAGTKNAANILAKLVRQRYFILKYGHSDQFYAYHQLFKAFLQTRAQKSLNQMELDHYRKKAALLLIKNGDIDEAAQCLIACRDFEELARLITTHALTLIGQGRHTLIIDWLNTLPPNIFKNDPWLTYWLGVAQLMIAPEKSFLNFETAFHFFSKRDEPMGQLLSWSGIIDALSLQFCNFDKFDKWLQLFKQIKIEYLSLTDAQMRCRVASRMFKALVLSRPHHRDVEKWANRALETGPKETLNIASWTYVRLQFYYFAIKTDYQKVQTIAEQLKKTAADYPYTSPMADINVLYTEMLALQATGRLKSSLTIIDEYRKVAKKSGIWLFDSFFLMHEASIQIDMNNGKKAFAVLQKLQAHEQTMNPWVKCFYFFQKARIGIMTQADTGIQENADQAFKLAQEIGCHFTILICMLQKVYISQIKGFNDKAQIQLNQYFDKIKNRASDQDLFMGFLTQAHLMFESEDVKKGNKALRQGLTIGKKHELLFIFADQPNVTAMLCERALVERIEESYVQTIIKKRRLKPSPTALFLKNWPWPIQIISLGSFEILINGIPIPLSRKTPKKIFNLLKAIIAYHNEKVPANWLMDELWPDSDGDRAMESLKVSIKRLRKMLGNSKAVQWKESVIWLNPELVWVDLTAFEGLYDISSRLAGDASNTKAMLNNIYMAVNLVRGPFLDGDNALPVFISRRSELEVLFTHLFQLVFTHETSSQKLPQIMAQCNRIVSDPKLSQEIYQKTVSRLTNQS